MSGVTRQLAVALAIVSGCACTSNNGTTTTNTASATTTVEPAGTDSPTSRRIVELVNTERSRAGVATLAMDHRLMAAAQIQAEQMADAGQMSHVLPQARYPTPTDRVEAVKYPWRATAENIAVDQDDPDDAVTRWMGSAGHRHNILNATYTQTGAGYVERSTHKYYVQVFALPR